MNATQLILTRHAYQRYCQRVEHISRDQLIQQLLDHIQQPARRKRGYIQLDGVWWRYGSRDDVIILHTCYGRHHIDMPEAIRWAKRHRDRINLGGGEAR